MAIQDAAALGSVHDMAVLLTDGRIVLLDGTPVLRRQPPVVRRTLRYSTIHPPYRELCVLSKHR